MNNQNEQLGMLDLLNIISFFIGLLNLEENLTQGDKQDLMKKFDEQTKTLLEEVHRHLESQDSQLNEIIERLEALEK